MSRVLSPTMLAPSLLLLVSMTSRLGAQFNQNGGTSISPSQRSGRWEIEYLSHGHLTEASLDRLVADTLVVTWQQRLVFIPVDSLRRLYRVVEAPTTSLGAAGFLLGAIIGQSTVPSDRRVNCGHPCINLTPPTELVVGAVLGLGVGVAVAALLEDEREYVLTGMPPAERMQILSTLVETFP